MRNKAVKLLNEAVQNAIIQMISKPLKPQRTIYERISMSDEKTLQQIKLCLSKVLSDEQISIMKNLINLYKFDIFDLEKFATSRNSVYNFGRLFQYTDNNRYINAMLDCENAQTELVNILIQGNIDLKNKLVEINTTYARDILLGYKNTTLRNYLDIIGHAKEQGNIEEEVINYYHYCKLSEESMDLSSLSSTSTDAVLLYVFHQYKISKNNKCVIDIQYVYDLLNMEDSKIDLIIDDISPLAIDEKKFLITLIKSLKRFPRNYMHHEMFGIGELISVDGNIAQVKFDSVIKKIKTEYLLITV